MSDLQRRRRIVRIADALLLQWLGEGFPNPAEIIRDAVPKGARIVDAQFDQWNGPGDVVLLIESPEFDPVPAGERWPELHPVFRTIYPTAGTRGSFVHPDDWDKAVEGGKA